MTTPRSEEAALIHHPDSLQCPCQHVLWCAGDMPHNLCGFNYIKEVHASAYCADFLRGDGRVWRIYIPLDCPRVDKRGTVFR